MSELQSAKRILICLRYGIGDLVMETPLLRSLRAAAPQARITGLGALPALQLLEGEAWLDELVSAGDFGFADWGDHGRDETRSHFEQWFRQRAFDLVLDVSHAVLGIRDTLWKNSGSPILDTGEEQNNALGEGLGGMEAIAAAAQRGWGIEHLPRPPVLTLQEEEKAFAGRFLQEHGCAGRRLVGVSAVASSALKRWPLTNIAALCDLLAAHGHAPLLLFEGPEQGFAELVRSAIEPTTHLVKVGPLHLRHTAALLARCAAFVGNDTGLMHLAAAVGTPPLAIFGPTSPAIYLPPGAHAFGGGGDGCPYRLRHRFGPPACVGTGACLHHGDGCISATGAAQVWEVLRGFLQPVAEAATPGGDAHVET